MQIIELFFIPIIWWTIIQICIEFSFEYEWINKKWVFLSSIGVALFLFYMQIIFIAYKNGIANFAEEVLILIMISSIISFITRILSQIAISYIPQKEKRKKYYFPYISYLLVFAIACLFYFSFRGTFLITATWITPAFFYAIAMGIIESLYFKERKIQ